MLTPIQKERKELLEALSKKIKEIKSRLPKYWVTAFILDNPEYQGQVVFLHNVMSGHSPHEETVNKIHTWIMSKPVKKKLRD